ncbi:aspartate-semialdehyde dehydrogenase [bacterium]|nr:aspartate-semialdehyde dehydrogenase [bacterium]
MKNYNVAVVGATGVVGQEMVRMLEKRKFPVASLKLLASQRSIGKTGKFCGKEIKIEELKDNSFNGIEIALFSAGSEISKKFAPIASKEGVFVIDNSSAWRMDADVPLVVPEVNAHTLSKGKKIIANPNCSTIQMVVVLNPIHRSAGIKRVVVSTYQAVSGAGKEAMLELQNQKDADITDKKTDCKVFPYQIAYNVIPHIDVFGENGYTREEIKMVKETQKIMNDESIKVTATCVRVPVFRGHSESVNIETEKKISPEEVKNILSESCGIIVWDDIAKLKYPLPLYCANKEETFVGRIRSDTSVENGLNLWIVSDNLLKGAALNAVQIAECLVEKEII